MTTVNLQTNFGTIVIQLDVETTPKTAENFINYVNTGFYEGTIFHRVISNFMIQGGGFNAHMEQKPTQAPIENEASVAKLTNKRGTIAMARTQDPHSATAQFFINVIDNDFLNYSEKSLKGWGYCVFGVVTEGMDVVDKIRRVPTTSKQGHQDVPKDEVIIQKAFLVEDEA